MDLRHQKATDIEQSFKWSTSPPLEHLNCIGCSNKCEMLLPVYRLDDKRFRLHFALSPSLPRLESHACTGNLLVIRNLKWWDSFKPIYITWVISMSFNGTLSPFPNNCLRRNTRTRIGLCRFLVNPRHDTIPVTMYLKRDIINGNHSEIFASHNHTEHTQPSFSLTHKRTKLVILLRLVKACHFWLNWT